MPRARSVSVYLAICETGGATSRQFGIAMHQLRGFFNEALEIASNDSTPPTNNLNLFMAPEFFLNEGTQLLTQKRWDMMVTSMCQLTQDNPGWIVIPGTALWDYKWEHATNVRHNTAPIFYGGQLIHAYCKRYPGQTEVQGADGWGVDYLRGNVSSEHVFIVEGVHFGIEICNDYKRGAFASWYDKTLGAAPGPGRAPYATQRPGVDIQLLPASGISPLNTTSYADPLTGARHPVDFRNVRIRPNGYFVVCDGSMAPMARANYHRKAVVYKRQPRRFVLQGLTGNGDPRILGARDNAVFTKAGIYPVPGTHGTDIMSFRYLPLEYTAP